MHIGLLMHSSKLIDPASVLLCQAVGHLLELGYLLGQCNRAGDLGQPDSLLGGLRVQLVSVVFHLLEVDAGLGRGVGGAAALGAEEPDDGRLGWLERGLRAVFHRSGFELILSKCVMSANQFSMIMRGVVRPDLTLDSK